MAQFEASSAHLTALRGVVVLLACLILGVFGEIWLALSLLHPWGSDFQIYYQAVRQAQAGLSAYFPYALGRSFIYYPFALTLLSLFVPLGKTLASYIWAALNVIAYGASIYLALQLSKKQTKDKSFVSPIGGPALVASILMTFGPFWSTIHVGQINGLVSLGLVLSLYLSETRKEILAGVCLALAIAMKLSPALFLLYFVCVRRYRVVLYCVGSLLLLTLIAWLQFGMSVFVDFLSVLPQISTVIDPHYYNQGILSLLLRLLLYFGSSVSHTEIANVYKLILMMLIGVSLFSGLLIPHNAQWPRRWLFALTVSLMTISSPLVWYHHGVFLLLPLAWLLVHPQSAYSLSGVIILLLVQGEYLYEMQLAAHSNEVFFTFSGLLVVAAQIFLTLVLAVVYLKELWAARRDFASNNELKTVVGIS